MKTATIAHHGRGEDWCHLCGKRQHYCADVWWSENAEHLPMKSESAAVAAGRYIRICDVCAAEILRAALEPAEAGEKRDE